MFRLISTDSDATWLLSLESVWMLGWIYVSFYNTAVSTRTFATPRTTWDVTQYRMYNSSALTHRQVPSGDITNAFPKGVFGTSMSALFNINFGCTSENWCHPEKKLFSFSKKIFSGSKYLKNVQFNFEKRSTGCYEWNVFRSNVYLKHKRHVETCCATCKHFPS